MCTESPVEGCPPCPLQESFKTALSAALNEEKGKAATLQKEVDLNHTALDCIMLTVQGLGAAAQGSKEEKEEEGSPRGKERNGAVIVGGKDASLSRGKRPVWIAGSVSGEDCFYLYVRILPCSVVT